MISIRSCSSNRELRITYTSDSHLVAELVGFSVSARLEVWLETGDAAGLQAFLVDLGKQGQPWSGTREWESIEGDFRLSVTCTALGNVIFNLTLRGLQGATEEWALTAGIDYELGQLEHLAQESNFEQTR